MSFRRGVVLFYSPVALLSLCYISLMCGGALYFLKFTGRTVMINWYVSRILMASRIQNISCCSALPLQFREEIFSLEF